MHRGLLPYLQDYAGGLIVIYHLVNDWLEEVLITFGERGGAVMALEQDQETPGAKGKGKGTPTLVIDAISEGHVETIVTATLCTHLIHVTCKTAQAQQP